MQMKKHFFEPQVLQFLVVLKDSFSVTNNLINTVMYTQNKQSDESTLFYFCYWVVSGVKDPDEGDLEAGVINRDVTLEIDVSKPR